MNTASLDALLALALASSFDAKGEPRSTAELLALLRRLRAALQG